MIIIVDYQIGNIGAIVNMFKKIGAETTISSNIKDIAKANKLILPGVGAFDAGIRNLNRLNLVRVLNKKILKQKIPILGICLGMQLFTKKSEEGKLPGLSWIDAETIKFKFNKSQVNLKIPHMGWNNITIKKQSQILKDMHQNTRFYFVHSYHVVCNKDQDILTTTYHGYNFASMVQRNNIIGVQFHPEKSHKFGMKLLENFVNNF